MQLSFYSVTIFTYFQTPTKGMFVTMETTVIKRCVESQSGLKLFVFKPLELSIQFALTYVQILIGLFGCGPRAKFRPSVRGGWEGLDRKMSLISRRHSPLQWKGGGGGRRGFWLITRSSYSRHQIHFDTLNCLFPSNIFLPRTYHFFHISRQQTFRWRSDILRSRHIYWVPLENSYTPDFSTMFKTMW